MSGNFFCSKNDAFVYADLPTSPLAHLMKQCNYRWFSRSSLVTTAAPSGNWKNQWIGWNKLSLDSCEEKLRLLDFSCLMNRIHVLKHRLNKRGLRQSPCSNPGWKGIDGMEKQSEMMDEENQYEDWAMRS